MHLGLVTRLLTGLLTRLVTRLLTRVLAELLTPAAIPVARRNFTRSLVLGKLIEQATVSRDSGALANSTKDPLGSPELVADGYDAVMGDGACDVVRLLERILNAE